MTRCRRLPFWSLALLIGIFLGPARAEELPKPMVTGAVSNGADTNAVALRNRLTVTVTNLSTLLTQARTARKPVILYLNGLALKGIEPEAVDTNRNTLRFHLLRSEEARKAWAALLGEPRFERKVAVSVGLEGDSPIETEVGKFTLVVIRLIGFWAFLAAAVGLALWIWRKKEKSEMLRDPGPSPGPGKFRPYSLAKVQMAIWFWLTVTSFLFIFLITYTFDSIPNSVFVLMGISAATGLGAMVQNASKDPDEGLDSLEKERRELEAVAVGNRTPEQIQRLEKLQAQIKWYQEVPASEGFFKDILTDAQGTSFHRLQMFTWTLVLGFLFGWEVFYNLAMPDFNNTLLALMGISSGTYLGFMITEKHSSQQQ